MNTIARRKTVLLLCLLGLWVTQLANAISQLTAAEYFFDSDPGVGKGYALSIGSPADSLNLNIPISIAGLTNGPHILYMRFQDSAGIWGLSVARAFNIIPAPDTTTFRIAKAEYFFDKDPGLGLGNSFTTGAIADSLKINSTISTSGLSLGSHVLFFRFISNYGTWSLSDGRDFNVIPPPDTATYKIAGGEYFFDSDPGVGLGTPISTGANADSIYKSLSIATTGLAIGPHSLNFRLIGTNKEWGNTDSRQFNIADLSNLASSKINYGEYFIDTDPGLGLATPISIASSDSFKINVPVNIPGIGIGQHNLIIRLRDSMGLWGSAETRNFSVITPEKPSAPLAAVEVFFDTDPGVGKGFKIASIANLDSINLPDSVLDNGLSNGTHTLFVRVMDSTGTYSLSEGKTFFICQVFPVANFKADYISFDSIVNFTNQTTGGDANTQFYWNFGDGSPVDSFQNPDNKYATQGIYTVSLIATNGGVCGDSITKKVIATSDTCNLISGFIYLAKVTDEVDFQDTSTGNIGSYYWDFGDGATSAQKNPIHQYAKAGNYLVSLAIKNGSNSCTDYSSQLITVGQSGCQAMFTDSIDNSALSVVFTDKSLSSGDLRYFWYFGDGNYSIAQNPTHIYSSSGTYQISLTISTSDGTCNDIYSTYLQVGQVKCSAAFTYFVDSTSNLVYFKDQIVGPFTNLYWNFGDSKTSVENNPIHPYENPGYYTVGLNTFNADNYCMDYYEQSILVGDANNDCEADFTYQSIDTTNYIVDFFDASKGDIIGYIWNFGDGVEIAQKNPQHTFNPGGYQNVCLTVVNSNGITSFKCKSVYSGSYKARDCKSQFTYTVDSVGNHVFYTDQSTGNPNNWNWNLGNGITATTQNGDVNYANNGFYIVSLKIKNSNTGCASRSIKIVGVGNTNKVSAGFGYDAKSFSTKADGYPVDFTGTGVGDHARLRWSFGDTSSTQNIDTTTLTPTHIYNLAGTYSVCLTFKNQLTGDSDVYCQNVNTSIACVNDVTPPTVYCKNISVQLNGSGNALITPAMVDSLSYDNCSSFVTLSLDKQSFTQADLGLNMVTLTVKDSSNNVSTCNAYVNVLNATDVASVYITNDLKVWPNPANDLTNIQYVLKENSIVEMTIFDLQGKTIENILTTKKDAGEYTLIWNSSGLAKGAYLLSVKTENGIIGRKMIIKQ